MRMTMMLAMLLMPKGFIKTRMSIKAKARRYGPTFLVSSFARIELKAKLKWGGQKIIGEIMKYEVYIFLKNNITNKITITQTRRHRDKERQRKSRPTVHEVRRAMTEAKGNSLSLR